MEKSFQYNSKTFIPVRKLTKGEFKNRREHMQLHHSLNKFNETFDYGLFYESARLNDCNDVDLFLMEGNLVYPCNILNYWGEPTIEGGYGKKYFNRKELLEQYERLEYMVIDIRRRYLPKNYTLDRVEFGDEIVEVYYQNTITNEYTYKVFTWEEIENDSIDLSYKFKTNN